MLPEKQGWFFGFFSHYIHIKEFLFSSFETKHTSQRDFCVVRESSYCFEATNHIPIREQTQMGAFLSCKEIKTYGSCIFLCMSFAERVCLFLCFTANHHHHHSQTSIRLQWDWYLSGVVLYSSRPHFRTPYPLRLLPH